LAGSILGQTSTQSYKIITEWYTGQAILLPAKFLSLSSESLDSFFWFDVLFISFVRHVYMNLASTIQTM
jgi:hypothetical protein